MQKELNMTSTQFSVSVDESEVSNFGTTAISTYRTNTEFVDLRQYLVRWLHSSTSTVKLAVE